MHQACFVAMNLSTVARSCDNGEIYKFHPPDVKPAEFIHQTEETVPNRGYQCKMYEKGIKAHPNCATSSRYAATETKNR